LTVLALAIVKLADDPAVKVPGACTVIPVTPDAATDRLRGALKDPCVTAQLIGTVAEPPVITLIEAGFVARVQAGWGAITTFSVAVRIITPLMPCSKIVYFPFTAADEAENVRDVLEPETGPKLTLTPCGRPPTATFALEKPVGDHETPTVAEPPGESVMVDGFSVSAELGPLTVIATLGSCSAPFASVAMIPMTDDPCTALLAALTVMVTVWFTPSVAADKVAVTPDGTLNALILIAEPADGQVRATVVLPPGATVMLLGVNTIVQLGTTFTARFSDPVWLLDPLVAVTLKP